MIVCQVYYETYLEFKAPRVSQTSADHCVRLLGHNRYIWSHTHHSNQEPGALNFTLLSSHLASIRQAHPAIPAIYYKIVLLEKVTLKSVDNE